MEEAERKRQEMLAAQKEGGKKSSGPAMDARKEMSKTKEQVEEEMKISLRIRIKPLDLDSMDSDELKQKAQKIFDTIYTKTSDNRRLREQAKELSLNWQGLNSLASAHPDPRIAKVQRDGHCHEAVMWYVHHLTEEMKEILRS